LKHGYLGWLTLGSLVFLWGFGAITLFYGSMVLGIKADCTLFDLACPFNGMQTSITTTVKLLPEWSLWPLFIVPFSMFCIGGFLQSFSEGQPIKLTPEQAKELEESFSMQKPKESME